MAAAGWSRERTATESELIALARALEGVVVQTATAESGAPEMAWGDSFLSCAPIVGSEANRKTPFATLVCSTDPGFDTDQSWTGRASSG